MVAVRVKVAASGPANGKPDTPENKSSTEPLAVTVEVAPESVMFHCCCAPLVWMYYANVAGFAMAGLTAIIANAKDAAKRIESNRAGSRMVIVLILQLVLKTRSGMGSGRFDRQHGHPHTRSQGTCCAGAR